MIIFHNAISIAKWGKVASVWGAIADKRWLRWRSIGQVEVGGEGVVNEALQVVGEAVELFQVAFGVGGQLRAAAVLASPFDATQARRVQNVLKALLKG